jgi:hypothetical protein
MQCQCERFLFSVTTIREIDERCARQREISGTLVEITSNFTKWMTVSQCDVCQRYWALEFPYGERKGTGRKCIYSIQCDDPVEWLKACGSPIYDIGQRFYSGL